MCDECDFRIFLWSDLVGPHARNSVLGSKDYSKLNLFTYLFIHSFSYAIFLALDQRFSNCLHAMLFYTVKLGTSLICLTKYHAMAITKKV